MKDLDKESFDKILKVLCGDLQCKDGIECISLLVRAIASIIKNSYDQGKVSDEGVEELAAKTQSQILALFEEQIKKPSREGA